MRRVWPAPNTMSRATVQAIARPTRLRLGRVAIGVDPHVAEVVPEPGFHERACRGVQRLSGRTQHVVHDARGHEATCRVRREMSADGRWPGDRHTSPIRSATERAFALKTKAERGDRGGFLALDAHPIHPTLPH